METEIANGTDSPTATLEPLTSELKEPKQKDKKKHKGKKDKLSKTPELLLRTSEGESSSKLSDKEYEKELAGYATSDTVPNDSYKPLNHSLKPSFSAFQ